MKILLVQTGFIGDVILSTAVIANISYIYPEAKITLLTTPIAAELVKHDNALHCTIAFDKRGKDSGFRGLFGMARKLKLESFDIAFSLHKSFRTSLLLYLAGIPLRYGFMAAAGKMLYSSTARREDLTHEVLRNLAIFRNIALEPSNLDTDLRIDIPEEVKKEAREILKPASAKKLIGLAPGSAWRTKQWTPEGYSNVAKELSSLGHSIVLIGGPEDKEIGAIIENNTKGRALNLIGKTSLILSAAIISELDLLISNDSAPVHIASALKVPVVVVYCATVEDFGFGPWNVSSKCLGVKTLACRPCGLHGANTCPVGTYACKVDLTPESVIAAARLLMDNG